MRFRAAVLLVCVLGVPVFGQDDPPASTSQSQGTRGQSQGTTGQNPSDDDSTSKRTFTPRPLEPPFRDERTAFFGSVYLGEVVDTFAADEVLNYINPEDANKQKLRAIAGVDFQYRLLGAAAKPDDALVRNRGNQLWVYGETVHGVRSRDVDCEAQNNIELSVCDDAPTPNPKDAQRFIAILRGASSLEAFVGLRYEMPWLLQYESDSPARMYIKAQAGFLSVAGGGGDVVDDHNISIGALAVGGRLEGSFLQVGYGRNDLFLRKADQRFVIDALLSIDPRYVPGFSRLKTDRLRPFIEFTGNFDGGGGSDSIQTWFGFDYEFRDVLGKYGDD